MDQARRIDRDRRDRVPSMTINPANYPALDIEIFDYAVNWQFNDGKGNPLDPLIYCKVMYTNGFVANKVRISHAWVNWTGSRDWWIDPGDGRLFICAYIVV